jgi:hypothetical protein
MKKLLACGFPVVKELIVGLIVCLDFHDFQKFRHADVVRLVGLQPTAVDASVFDERRESAM